MPLIACPDCKKQVSDAAPVCIHCGRPIKNVAPPPIPRVQTADDSVLTRNRGCGDLVLYGGLALVIFVIFIAAMTRCSSSY